MQRGQLTFESASYFLPVFGRGRDTLQGAPPPDKGRGRGPLDTSSRDSGDEGDNGRGRNGAKRSGVPLEGIPSPTYVTIGAINLAG